MTHVVLTEVIGKVGLIRINRPEAMNAITPAMLAELKTAVLDAAGDRSVRAIVLTGAWTS